MSVEIYVSVIVYKTFIIFNRVSDTGAPIIELSDKRFVGWIVKITKTFTV